MKALRKVDVFGIPVTSASGEEIAEAIVSAIRERRRGCTVCAVNVHTWSEAKRSDAIAQAFRDSLIAWADGVPIAWAGRWLGMSTVARIHGHDLMRLMLARPVAHYFYGSTPGVLADLERNVRREFPAIRIAGLRSPRFTKRAVEIPAEEAAAIRDSGAELLWVALGAPKQELWLQLNRDRVDVPVMAGVGAAFEILAGRFARAPLTLQSLGLEWAWRLSQDPGRLWRRYLSSNGLFVSTVMRSALGLQV